MLRGHLIRSARAFHGTADSFGYESILLDLGKICFLNMFNDMLFIDKNLRPM